MEKTFEELIDDKAYFNTWLKELTESEKDLIKELIQQVREATIAECKVIADKYYFQNSRNIIRDINDLPTDRIKIEE